MAAVRVETPEAVLEVYRRHRGVHVYGIADVAQLWHASRWWRAGRAVVGVLEVPGASVPIVYAIAAEDDPATLDLLEELAPQLPSGFLVHGPRGVDDRLSPAYVATWRRDYLKLELSHPQRLPPSDPTVTVLGPDDVEDLEALYGLDPIAGDFFHAGLLASGHYAGRWHDGVLVASAGVHVVDRDHGVAAIANVTTHPDHRRHGYGTAVVATLVRRLLAELDVIGLNVREANADARRFYERLGFAVVSRYVEAELVEQRGGRGTR